ncbi:queuosine precursor transporter [Pseudochelatococcus sp. G4_1912]|uniref:queuosine precursor transporter n=1 Tax=Pseudochelatococcus sp. G4_1912 TaxID=3114288 RepID=UPI0039C630F3
MGRLRMDFKRLWWPVAAMAAIVVLSNIAVQYPFTPWGLQDYLTWGAFTYPVAFLVTDLTNRRFGVSAARRLVGVGFVLAVVVSAIVSEPRIAAASGIAFLFGQLLDVSVFNRLRQLSWWCAPLASGLIGSAIDTALFFSLAFAGAVTDVAAYSFMGLSVTAPVWMAWAVSDFLVKVAMALLMLVPYGALLRAVVPVDAARNAG